MSQGNEFTRIYERSAEVFNGQDLCPDAEKLKKLESAVPLKYTFYRRKPQPLYI